MPSALPCGERLVRCLLGEPVDRIPFGIGLGWAPWGQTMDRWRRVTGDPGLKLAERFAYDKGFAQPAVAAGIFPAFETRTLEETADFIVTRDERGITRRNRRDGESMPEFLDYPVKTPDDWARLKAERLRADEPGRVTQDWDTFRARLKETGEAVQVGAFPFGVFGTPRDLLGVETLLTAFYDWPEMVRDMMNHLTGLWIAVWERVAREVRIDHIHIWEDMSGRQGSLISPAMIAEFMMPCYDRIADFARSAGVRLVSVDSDGYCGELVRIMTRHGVNVFFPFEVQAGNDIREYRRQYPALGILFGLDKRALSGTRQDVDRELEKAMWMVEHGGRYVPGFDHLIPPDAKWDLFEYAAREFRAACRVRRSEKGWLSCL